MDEPILDPASRKKRELNFDGPCDFIWFIIAIVMLLTFFLGVLALCVYNIINIIGYTKTTPGLCELNDINYSYKGNNEYITNVTGIFLSRKNITYTNKYVCKIPGNLINNPSACFGNNTIIPCCRHSNKISYDTPCRDMFGSVMMLIFSLSILIIGFVVICVPKSKQKDRNIIIIGQTQTI